MLLGPFLKDTSPDIILVNPPLLWGQEFRMDIKPPLNLLYLASWLNAHGQTAELIDVISSGKPPPGTPFQPGRSAVS